MNFEKIVKELKKLKIRQKIAGIIIMALLFTMPVDLYATEGQLSDSSVSNNEKTANTRLNEYFLSNPYKHDTKTISYRIHTDDGPISITKPAYVWDCVWLGEYWQDEEGVSGNKAADQMEGLICFR